MSDQQAKQARCQRCKAKKAKKKLRVPRCSCCGELSAVGWQRNNQEAWEAVCGRCAAPGQTIQAEDPAKESRS